MKPWPACPIFCRIQGPSRSADLGLTENCLLAGRCRWWCSTASRRRRCTRRSRRRPSRRGCGERCATRTTSSSGCSASKRVRTSVHAEVTRAERGRVRAWNEVRDSVLIIQRGVLILVWQEKTTKHPFSSCVSYIGLPHEQAEPSFLLASYSRSSFLVAVLNDRINRRVDKMIEAGLIAELTDFHHKYNEMRVRENE